MIKDPHFYFKLTLTFLMLMSVGPVYSESVKESNCEQKLTLEEFRALALKDNYLIASIDSKYAKQLAEAFDLKVMANPELEVERTFTTMELNGDNDAQNMVSLGQTLRLSDFGSRERVAKLIKEAGKQGKEAEIFELSQRIRLLYHRLWSLQQTQKFMNEAKARADRKLTLIRDAVQKGLLSKGDEKLFEGEKYRLAASQLGVNSSIALTRHEIQKNFGISCLTAKSAPDSLAIPNLKSLLTFSKDSEISEESRLMILDQLASEQMELAELDAYPEFTPRLVYQHTNDGGDFFGFGITIPLPAWNRNQSEKLRSEAKLREVEAKKKLFTPEGLEAQVKYLEVANRNSDEQLEIFNKNVIPSFKESLQIQESLFLKGKGDVMQVWQGLRLLSEAQEQSLKLWNNNISARIRLSLLIGKEI